jgi:hypothetical protein
MKIIVRILFTLLLIASALPATQAKGALMQRTAQNSAAKSRKQYLKDQKKQQKQWRKPRKHSQKKLRNLNGTA